MAEDLELMSRMWEGLSDPEIEARFPFYSLTAPGMPLPGPDFVNHAVNLGDPIPVYEGKGSNTRLVSHGPKLTYLYRRALYDSEFAMPLPLHRDMVNSRFVPGHIWGDVTVNFSGGPQPADVMLIGKMPGQEERTQKRNFVGPTSEVLIDALDELGIQAEDYYRWYLCNLVRFPKLDITSDSLPKSFIADCLPILHQELRLVRPRFILCLGTESAKALLGPTATVSNMVGRTVEYTFPLHEYGQPETLHTVRVIVVTHPAAVFRKPELTDAFHAQLSLFRDVVQGITLGNVETNVDHRVIFQEQTLSQLVDEILADPDPDSTIIGVDAEWEGDAPTEPGAYLRTVQFSHKEKFAACVVLRHQGGAPAFKPSIARAVFHLRRLLKSTAARRVRVGGHFFRSDLPWLIHLGLDLRNEYAPDVNDPRQGGWDTGLMYHAYNETARFKLEEMATRLTTVPRYDTELLKWRDEFCKKRKIKAEDLEGYGLCPSQILYSYAAYDADATRRCYTRFAASGGLLDRDWHESNVWRPYLINHMASLAFLEMEMEGIPIDRKRADELSAGFMQSAERLLMEVRQELNWQGSPGRKAFSPGSHFDMRAVLFGPQYGRKKNQELTDVLPPGAISFGLTPIKTTGKRAKMWTDVMGRRQTQNYTPSTDKETLGALGYQNPTVAKLRDYKFVNQVLHSSLRAPTMEDGEPLLDDDGNFTYEKGMIASLRRDGRVHTRLFTTKETGRVASARPPLQNLSNRREDDYRRILGEAYRYPLRSMMVAPPGYLLCEADLQVAEVATLGWLSQDAQLIDHARRSCLPESHPDHFDIHSNMAVTAFNLDCAPLKSALKRAGLSGMRVAAKNVVFGVPYGRSAPAISRQCAEEGVTAPPEQCEQLIQAYFARYPDVEAFLERCRNCVTNPGWMMTPYGRKRRFIRTSDQQVRSEQERQAQNFLIQSSVADAIYLALYNLYEYRRQNPGIDFKFLLQIHDAILCAVRIDQAAHFRDYVIPECMTRRVDFWPCYLDGTRMPYITEPHQYGVETKLCRAWGQELKPDELAEYGIAV
jgi:uracil-DNA glycosylase family 4